MLQYAKCVKQRSRFQFIIEIGLKHFVSKETQVASSHRSAPFTPAGLDFFNYFCEENVNIISIKIYCQKLHWATIIHII